MGQKALLVLLGTVAVFGTGVAIAQAPGGSIRQVPLSEIEKEAALSAPQGVTIDFSNGGLNNVTVQTSDNSGVVQITSKTNAVTAGPGTAHLKVAVFGQCPKPKGMEVISCDPIPVYSVTIHVR